MHATARCGHVGRHVHGHVYGHMCGYVHGHVYGDVCRYVQGHVYRNVLCAEMIEQDQPVRNRLNKRQGGYQ